MFLHIGGEIMIPTKDIIAILSIETKSSSERTKEFFNIADDEGFVVNFTEKPHSFIVTKDKVYSSPISSTTLKKRATNFLNENIDEN